MDKKYICLRDDDTNYFTEPGELASCYGKFWGKIPVTLATIPFVHGSDQRIMKVPDQAHKYQFLRKWELNASAEELSKYHHIFPIGLNAELVDELKAMIKSGKLEIAQHGVNHRYTEFGEEMLSKSMGYCAIRDGKEYLEKVFEQSVKVFIPPANTIDNICAEYVHSLGMDLFCCGSMVFTSRKVKVLKGITHPLEVIDSFKGRILGQTTPIRSRGGYEITGSITYDAEKNRKDIKKAVMKSLSDYGFASLTTHYRLLSDNYEKGKKYNYRKNFHVLLEELSGLGNVEFITASEYIEKAGKKFLWKKRYR